MSIQNIDIGNSPYDGTGDGARTAGQKINANFQYLENLINATASVKKRYDTAPDNTRAAMIADQGNQVNQGVYYVQDARSASEIGAGDPVYYAYYEYLGTTNGDISDYRALDADEVEGIQNSMSWKQKTIIDLDLEGNVDADDASNGNVIFVYDGADITYIIFDSAFTKVLEKARNTFSTTNYALNIFNATENTHLSAVITSFELINSNANLKVGVSGILTTSVAVTHVLHFDLPIELPDYTKIGNLYFNTAQNQNPLAIEDGNHFYGHPEADRYVVGRVVDATDFDVDDSLKAKLFIDTE